jgi:hypothetical protein
VVFEVDLLKSQEINLDYILELIFEHNKKIKSKSELVDEVRRVIRASLGNRAKESLLVDFINQTDLDQIGDKASVIDAFFTFAQAEQQREAQELISAESLNAEAARRYITTSLKREFASDNGTELNAVLPKMSPLNPQYLTKKQSVFQKIAAFVEKFKGVGHGPAEWQTTATTAPTPSMVSKTGWAFPARHCRARARAQRNCGQHRPLCPPARYRASHPETHVNTSCHHPVTTNRSC